MEWSRLIWSTNHKVLFAQNLQRQNRCFWCSKKKIQYVFSEITYFKPGEKIIHLIIYHSCFFSLLIDNFESLKLIIRQTFNGVGVETLSLLGSITFYHSPLNLSLSDTLNSAYKIVSRIFGLIKNEKNFFTDQPWMAYLHRANPGSEIQRLR